MKIEINHVSKYKSLICKDGGTTIEGGLLDDVEQHGKALEFIELAYEIYPSHIRIDSFNEFLQKWMEGQ